MGSTSFTDTATGVEYLFMSLHLIVPIRNWLAFFLVISIIAAPRIGSAASAPSITTAPQNQGVWTGSNAVFTVVASGQAPLSYQWSHSGTNLTNGTHFSGATTATLTVSNVAAADAGIYKVVVSNSHGTATTNATLTVFLPPGITTGPQSQGVWTGSNAVFIVVASGQPPLSYQWSHGGTNLTNGTHFSGATNATLTISNVVAADAGIYQVIVSNSHGMATTNATLTVLSPAVITAQPQNLSVGFRSDALFTVAAGGQAPLNYQWTFNGAKLTNSSHLGGATGSALTVSNVLATDAGNYQVVVTNQYGSVTSSVAALTVLFTNHVHFVNASNGAPLWPYADWATAATNIQDAVDAAIAGDRIFVTNGIYTTGSRVTGASTNCVVVTNAVSLVGVAGPALTVIDGGGIKRCVSLAGGATLSGFTLTNGTTSEGGAGVFCASLSEVVSNCVMTGNNASIYTASGGGAYFGTLTNCTLTGNVALLGGGAAYSVLNHCLVSGNGSGAGSGACYATLNNCLVSSNYSLSGWATYGAGAFSSTLNNCTLTGNTAVNDGGGAHSCTLSNCVLSGNSAGQWGGGARSCTLYDCVLTGGSAVAGGGAKYCTLIRCVVTNNSAYLSGGVDICTLTNCVLANNSSQTTGGGANSSALYNCLVAGNYCSFDAGGAEQSTLVNCTITGNSSGYSTGGVDGCALTNSIVYFNNASGNGNYSGTNYLSWCCTTPLPNAGPGDAVVGVSNISTAPAFVNSSNDWHLQGGSPCINAGNNSYVPATTDLDGNPRMVGPFADIGAYEYQAATIVITTQPANQSRVMGQTAQFTLAAVSPFPLGYQWFFNSTLIPGATNATLTVSNVQAGDAGNYAVVVTNNYGSVTSSSATLTIVLLPSITSQPQSQTTYFGATAVFSVTAGGTAPLNYQWRFGGVPLFDGGQISGATNAALSIANVQPANLGNYSVVVTNNYGAITSVVATLNATNQFHYVNLNNPAPVPPYTSWATAATNIQDAVDAAVAGDSVYVTNGIYQSGNRVKSVTTNCVVVTNAVSILSVSGAAQTVIDGGSVKRCVYLAAGATLTGFTLANGATSESGGGAYCESTSEVIADCVLSGNNGDSAGLLGNGGGAYQGTLTNCLLSGNSARLGGGAYGGVLNNCIVSGNSGNAPGVYACTLNNCTLIGNQTGGNGGGACASTLSNSVLTANSAYSGGGAEDCTLFNCTLSNNIAQRSGGGADSSTLNGCILTGNNANIDGGGANNCTLISCLLSNNVANLDVGGGANGSTLTNCLVLSNSAASGGGVSGSSLYNCLLAGNGAIRAGGAKQSVLVNCTVVNNFANFGDGGGVGDSCMLTNSIVYFNTSPANGNYAGNNYMSWCCTTPLPNAGADDTIVGVSNISSAPVFADAAHGNFRLYPGSPCINTGNNAAAPVAVDLDGNARIVNGTVDIGAYEFQNYPFIEIQPTNQTVPFGEPSVSLSVLAVGPGTLTYQWRFNGANISGATNSTLTLTFVQYSQAGNYSVVVVNSYGSVTSSDAVLTVVAPTPPAFVLQPTNQTVAVAATISLTASATAAPAAAYHWYFNGAELADDSHYSGSATANLQVSNTTTNDNGNYFVVATNTAGGATSLVAVVSVLTPPSITLQPADQTVMQGSNAIFTAAASGDAPLSYQWLLNGNILSDGGQISGATTTNLTISNLQFTNGGNLVFVASNPVGSATSGAAALNVLAPPIIVLQPAAQNALPGGSAAFSAAAIGTQPIGYQWFFNNTPLADDSRIVGATTNSLTVGSVQTNDNGGYFIVASNAYGAVTSSIASLTVVLPVVITQSPARQTNAAGSIFALTIAADGSAPFGYRWYFGSTLLTNNTRVSGASAATLSISNAALSDTGNYFAVVTNLLSAATSSVATVTVLTPPSVTTQPQGRSTPLGLTNSFSAVGSGAVPLRYQWRLNGTDIPGATNNSYFIAATTTNDLGIYQFVVSNAVGFAVSSNALLTIGPVAAWGNNANNQCLVPPGLNNVTSIAGGLSASLSARLDGNVTAWGGSLNTITNTGWTNVVALSAGYSGGLALIADGEVLGSFSSSISPLNYKLSFSNAVAISVGYQHALALRAEGMVVGWGAAPTSGSLPPAAIVPPGLTHVTAISAGYQHSLALRSDGTVAAWGVGSATNVPPGLSNVVAIAAGTTHSLALKSDGTVIAWGTGLGVSNLPPNLSNIVAIAAGTYTDQRVTVSFAVRSNGTVLGWGLSLNGQTNIPAGLSNVVAVAPGVSHVLALVNDGSPQIIRAPVGGVAWSGSDYVLKVVAAGTATLNYQWLFNGTNLDGATNATLLIPAIQSTNAGNYQVVVTNAFGTAASLPVPVTVLSSAPFLLTQSPTNLTGWLGNKLSLTAAAGGSGPLQYQWLLNGTNILGATNDTLTFPRLHMTNAGSYVLSISNSFGAITSSIIKLTVQQVLVWGDGANGTTNMPPGLTNVIAIGANFYNNIVLKADGTVTVWGNSSGLYVPTNSVVGVSNVVEVSAGYNQELVLKSNGRPYLWGQGTSSTFTNLVAAQSNIVAVVATSSFTGCALLRADGTLLQFFSSGISTNNGVTNCIALATCDDGYLVLRADGKIYSYGGGLSGSGSGVSNAIALAAGRYQGLALKRDGTVTSIEPSPAWPGVTNFSGVIDVASTMAFNLSPEFIVLSDGSIVWGGFNGNATTNVPYGITSVQVLNAGNAHCLALLSDHDFPPVFLHTALNTTNFVVSSKGSAQWFGQTKLTHDGTNAAQSAAIGNNTATSMRTWVYGPTTAKFWWKVSSATNHGILSFSSGSTVLTNVSGEADWRQVSVNIPPGGQILKWTYAKDGAAAAGLDTAWVDQLQITNIRPSILTQPVSQTVVGGTNVSAAFTVTVAGTPPFNYRWNKDGNVLVLHTNASADSLTFTNVTRTNSGVYFVVVTNLAGSATSSNAILDVHVPQLLGAPAVQPDGSLAFSATDADGGLISSNVFANLQLQASTNLVDWTTLPNALNYSNGLIYVQDSDATNSADRFYRILENW